MTNARPDLVLKSDPAIERIAKVVGIDPRDVRDAEVRVTWDDGNDRPASFDIHVDLWDDERFHAAEDA